MVYASLGQGPSGLMFCERASCSPDRPLHARNSRARLANPDLKRTGGETSVRVAIIHLKRTLFASPVPLALEVFFRRALFYCRVGQSD